MPSLETYRIPKKRNSDASRKRSSTEGAQLLFKKTKTDAGPSNKLCEIKSTEPLLKRIVIDTAPSNKLYQTKNTKPSWKKTKTDKSPSNKLKLMSPKVLPVWQRKKEYLCSSHLIWTKLIIIIIIFFRLYSSSFWKN